MIYIYDILLNFMDMNLSYEFYEWRSEDHIDHIKKIPLVKVDSKCLSDIMTHEIVVDHDFLLHLEDMTEVFQNRRVELLPFACIFSDSTRCIAIEFNPEGKSIYHSKLMLEEEEETLDLCQRLESIDVSFEMGDELKLRPFLTRLEEEKRNFLLHEIEVMYQEKNREKITYFYQEYFNQTEEDLNTSYQKLKQSLNTYNENHDRLYELAKLCATKKI